VTSCTRKCIISIDSLFSHVSRTINRTETYITSKVLLPPQDGIVCVQLTFELRDELLDALLIRRLPAVLLEHPFYNNASRDRLKLGILDARRLLELGVGLALRGD